MVRVKLSKISPTYYSTDLLLNSPLLCNLILPLHLLLLKLSDVPHSNLLTEFNKHLIFHLENKNIDITALPHILK